ncbi:hypothetical protein [Streptomyces sp. NPDC014623]|uniref:hypothetical protein n=1 Tax=Streptomyces sp. NPDC014623 TaxID=3364875 RepID=UPI0036F79C62
MSAEKTEPDVRCDREVKTTPGCVFSSHKPAYVMSASKFPAAAAHARLIQNKWPGHHGLRGSNPLAFPAGVVLVPDPPASTRSIVDHNRGVICPTSWERGSLTTMSPEPGVKDVPSCSLPPSCRRRREAAVAAGP